MNELEHSQVNGASKFFSVPLIVLLIAGIAISFSLLPTGATIVDPMEKLKKLKIPITTLWGFLTISQGYRLFRASITTNQLKNELIRVGFGRVTITKDEYRLIIEVMRKWDVDIGELIRYSVISVIEAHFGEESVK